MGVVEATVIGGIMTFAAAAFSSVEKRKQERKLEEAQKKQQEAQLASQGEAAAKERRAQIRESRIKRAQVQNVAAASSQQASSAAITGGQNVTAQAGQNIGNINTAMSQASVASAAAQNVMDVQSDQGSIFSQIVAPTMSSVGSQLFSSGMGSLTEKKGKG